MNVESPNNIWILQGMLKNKKAMGMKKLLALISLAHIASKESIRILEAYCKNPDSEMKTYARLAFEEAKYLAKCA